MTNLVSINALPGIMASLQYAKKQLEMLFRAWNQYYPTWSFDHAEKIAYKIWYA